MIVERKILQCTLHFLMHRFGNRPNLHGFQVRNGKYRRKFVIVEKTLKELPASANDPIHFEFGNKEKQR